VLYLDPPRVLLETFFGGVYSIRVFFFPFFYNTSRISDGNLVISMQYQEKKKKKAILFFRDFRWGPGRLYNSRLRLP
jgi:hypothetical protein